MNDPILQDLFPQNAVSAPEQNINSDTRPLSNDLFFAPPDYYRSVLDFGIGEYTKTTRYYDFSEAYKVFNGSGNKFTVPLFRDFLKLNGNRPQDKYNKVNFHNNLK